MTMTLNLKKLSVDELLILRDRINAMLESRVVRERRELEARLQRLQRFKPVGSEPGNNKSSPATVRKPAKSKNMKQTKTVAPKYRNPENPDETWAGRGHRPRWMRAMMDGGKDLEYFRI
jgi:DNA-binding protein H-NS